MWEPVKVPIVHTYRLGHWCQFDWWHCESMTWLLRYNRLRDVTKGKTQNRGHPDLNQGRLDLQSNALPTKLCPLTHLVPASPASASLHHYFPQHCTDAKTNKLGGTRIWTREVAWCDKRQNTEQGAPGFEPGTSRSAVECSTHWAMPPNTLGASITSIRITTPLLPSTLYWC